jgi:hypothetical protein
LPFAYLNPKYIITPNAKIPINDVSNVGFTFY